MNTVLEVKNLVKHFPEVKAVDGVSFSIEAGTCFGLLGPNGAGKTTTIEVIEGILSPNVGEIFYKGKPRGESFKEEVGIQFQNTELQQHLTIKEILKTFRNLYGRRANMKDLIEKCHLQDILNRDNHKISGGQKQRLLLAMALANDPMLVFLDEPTTGLDPQARRYLWDIVEDIKSENKTVVLTTHYMEEAQILCDQIAIMDSGKIIAMGSPEELLERYCKGTTLVLSDDVNEEKLSDLPWKHFKTQGTIEIQIDDLNACLKTLIERKVDLSSMTVRSRNLEDLFLKLTGRRLRN
jgi:ABC-2 type transport system ATP-binding protein